MYLTILMVEGELHLDFVPLPSFSVLTIEVELLIYAHDCFTLACHMEGISTLLQTARSVTASLAAAKEYNLMVFDPEFK